MAFPYTNKEIQEIADTIAELLFGWITISRDGKTTADWGMFSVWSSSLGDEHFWSAWSMYGEKYCALAKSRGLCRDMLSEEQRAIVCSTTKQTLLRVSEEADRGEGESVIFKRRSTIKGERDWDIEQQLKAARMDPDLYKP